MRSYPLFILFAAFALGAENLLPNGNFDEGKTEALHWEKVDNLTSFWRTDGARGRILELDTRPERYQVLEYQKKRKENPATPPPKPVIPSNPLKSVGAYEGAALDSVLLDVKQFNPERHRRLTGRDNTQTLRTAQWLEQHGRPFWLRYVLVPGWSDDEADIRALGEHFKAYTQLQRVEILPYHTLGVHKYEAMGWEYPLRGVKENTPAQLDRAKALFDEYFPLVVVN